MSIGTGWYATNQARSYPLHPLATTVSDSGVFLPEDLIVDLKLRFPGNFADTARISYASAAETVSLVIVSGEIPIASATVPREILRGFSQVPLIPIADGAEGYVVFGPSTSQGVWTFSSDSQSRLSRSAVTSQANIDVSSRLSRRGSVPGTGPTVYLSGSGDVVVRRDTRRLAGEDRSAVIIGLGSTDTRNVLAEYSGPCGRRPESQNCGELVPVESVNNVGPDCCGRIFVEFRGCAEIIPIANRCGIVVRCELTTEEVCRSPVEKLPDENGNLPYQGDDTCDDPDSPSANSNQVFE